MCHNYPIVCVGKGEMIDITGEKVAATELPRPDQFISTLDLDRTLIHYNFNEDKVAWLLKEHPHEVEMEQDFPLEAWYLLRSVKPGVRVRDLCRQYQIEILRDYRARSRDQINQVRREGKRI